MIPLSSPKARVREPELRDSAQTTGPNATSSGITPLPAGSAVGSFVLRSLHSADEFGMRYRASSSASDSEVIIEEYLPRAIARREADGTLGPRTPAQAALWDEGLQAFLQESEQMSRLNHPSLLRIGPVWQARGTAYRMRIGGEGRPLADLVAAMTEPPGEPWLRQLLDPLLGALQAMHEAGWVHGNVRPSQIAMRADGSPVLLDSGAVRIAIGEHLAEPADEDLEAGFLPPELTDASLDWPIGPWSDLHALAQVLRYCITGQAPLPADPDAPLADADARPSLGPRSLNARYAPGLVAALERSLALEPRQRPQSVAEFRHAVDAPVMLRAVPPSAHARLAPVSGGDAGVDLPALRAELPRAERQRAEVARVDVARAEGPRPAHHASTIPFSREAAREPAWAAPAPDLGYHHQEPAQVFEFHAPDVRRAPRPAGAARPARRWPWALGGVLAGAALTGAVVFFGLRPSAQVHFALAPLGAGSAEAPVTADPRMAPTPDSAASGMLLPSTPLPPRSAATGPEIGAAPGMPAPPTGGAAPTGVAPGAAPTAAAPAAPMAATPAAPAPTGVPPGAFPGRASPAPAGPAAANQGVPPPPVSEVRQAATAAEGAEARTAARAADSEDDGGAIGEQAGEPPSSPLVACSPRTNFALYRCMQTQCERSQYYTHPQCIRLRVRDELP